MASTLAIVLAAPLLAQTWQTAANNPGDVKFYLPRYPVAFVAALVNESPGGSGIQGNYHIGADVLSANNPDNGHHLFIVLPNGSVKKLFPLPEHEQIPGLIDTPAGQLIKGSVIEPNVSEDGRRLYFSYFHDTTFESSFSFGLNRLPLKGADLYALNLSALIANPNLDPATLPVQRLTFRQYSSNGQQANEDKYKSAMNQTLANSTAPNDWGTVFMHAVEMRTAAGLKLVYVSDERRLRNSNAEMAIGHANHNFNLHVADLAADGSLQNSRQSQYYTTTSVLSPSPLRNGLAFSYQASTEDARNWHIQGMNSEGRWYPIIGYGVNPELFHLGSFCVSTTGANPGDYLVATRYYNANNEGFGTLWAQDLSQSGLNTYDKNTYWGILPQQVGSYLVTQGTNSNDYPSPKQNGQYVGKFTSPRCGGPDELFMAYTPTSANGRLNDDEGNKSIYHSMIAYRPSLEPFHPFDAVNPAAGTGLRIVVDDSSDAYTLVWPTPILPWQARVGDAEQQNSPPIADPLTTVAKGMPFAQVGTSALHNTDRRPFDCWLGSGGQTPYSPNKANVNVNQENDLIVNNTDGFNYIQNQGNFCESIDPMTVLGVAIQLTSNRANMSAGFNPGYSTDGNGKNEAARLIGVYDVRNQADQSFQAVIPANSPFEFHLLDRQYGMKLTDVRNWHSLKARETRTDCGGCHQHVPGEYQPFAGKVADQQAPLNLVEGTTFLSYNAQCEPVLRANRQPTKNIPEWKVNIWPKFDLYCGDCHNAARSTDPAALTALGYTEEADAYNKLKNRNYANTKLGALGSPAFWAARGERSDGRNNNLPKYQPNYAAGVWGFRFSAVHAVAPNLCGQADIEKARWVYRFGNWIDNHMPRDTGAPYGWQFDAYHPTADIALTSSNCSPTQATVGFWDDGGILASVQVLVNDVEIASYPQTRNGSRDLSLSGLTPADSIKVIAIDPSDNRQIYEKSVQELITECVPANPQPGPKVRRVLKQPLPAP